MISKKEVEHIAKLARIGLTSGEIEKFQKELSSILDYFEKLEEVDVSEAEPTSHSITRALAKAMRTSFSSLPSPRKRGSVGEDTAAASLTTRALAKGGDEAAASLTTRAIASSTELENVTRKDEVRLNGASVDEAEKLLDLVPDKKNGYVKVRAILK